MRHINIPVFIPHMGCPNQCIFCNQRYISGTLEFKMSDVTGLIENSLKTVSDDCECEIAFFGGSFTGIDRELMLNLLDLAQGYVNQGRVTSIRMSTRPDYISNEIVSILKKYTISAVELGIQSMNDEVLYALKRGHTSSDTVNAAKLLKEASIPFVGQMMIGLPWSSREDELYCAKMICKLGAVGARIYPTLVFKHTELENLVENGGYTPLSIEDAVLRSAAVLEVFEKYKVTCIRIGLCDSENLHSDETFVVGPNSPAIGEMVKSRLYYNKLLKKVQSLPYGSCVVIYCPRGAVSQVIGNKKENVIKLKNELGIKIYKVIEDENLDQYDLIIKLKEENSCV